MPEVADKVKTLALDLRTGFPRSAAEPLADYAIAARAVDKCRAELVGTAGEYHYACPLTRRFTDYAGLSVDALRDCVATGATDAEIEEWIRANAKQRPRAEILRWSAQERERRLSELPDELLAFMTDYIAENLPPESYALIKTWFDVYDVEEKRLG